MCSRFGHAAHLWVRLRLSDGGRIGWHLGAMPRQVRVAPGPCGALRLRVSLQDSAGGCAAYTGLVAVEVAEAHAGRPGRRGWRAGGVALVLRPRFFGKGWGVCRMF